MEKDKDIEKLFKDFHPTDEKRDYVRELDKKMQVVDIVRGEHKRTAKAYRIVSVCCMLMGFGMGMLFLSLAMHPIEWDAMMETISWLQLPAGMLLLLCERGNMLLYLLATLSIALGLLPMLRMESGWLPEGIRIKN